MEKFVKNRILILFLLIATMNLIFSGCYSQREVTNTDDKKLKISKILLDNDNIVEFTDDSLGYAYLYNDEIIRIKEDGEQEVIPLSSVKTMYSEEFDIHKTIWFGIGCAAILYLLVLDLFATSLDGNSFGG
ncbi:MAG: hypothetical protein PVF17_07695 [Ignavibacteria bacterium]|jgi:hypothetical protein